MHVWRYFDSFSLCRARCYIRIYSGDLRASYAVSLAGVTLARECLVASFVGNEAFSYKFTMACKMSGIFTQQSALRMH